MLIPVALLSMLLMRGGTFRNDTCVLVCVGRTRVSQNNNVGFFCRVVMGVMATALQNYNEIMERRRTENFSGLGVSNLSTAKIEKK